MSSTEYNRDTVPSSTTKTVYEAANNTFWLTKNEITTLSNNKFAVFATSDLPGWDFAECGTTFNGRITCQVNNSQNQRDTLREIKNILWQ